MAFYSFYMLAAKNVGIDWLRSYQENFRSKPLAKGSLLDERFALLLRLFLCSRTCKNPWIVISVATNFSKDLLARCVLIVCGKRKEIPITRSCWIFEVKLCKSKCDQAAKLAAAHKPSDKLCQQNIFRSSSSLLFQICCTWRKKSASQARMSVVKNVNNQSPRKFNFVFAKKR